jgi:hypothetical protein
MTKHVALLIMSLSLLAPAIPGSAHHAWNDPAACQKSEGKKPEAVTGTVTKVEWQNPHVWYHMDVKDKAGKTINVGLMVAPPSQLQRREPPITFDSIKAGDQLTAEVRFVEDGAQIISCGSKILSFAPAASKSK